MNDNSAKGLSCQSEVIGLLITLTHARYLDAAADGEVAVCPCIIHVSPFYAYLVLRLPARRRISICLELTIALIYPLTKSSNMVDLPLSWIQRLTKERIRFRIEI